MVEVYIATYSQVDVYESTIDNIPLMRRCEDNWVNATQILKIAGFGKAQRTRLLEKEVHSFKHEKIQGGYGRFQGTWVPLDFAKMLALRHKIDEDLLKVLYYNPLIDPPLEKKMKNKPAERKRKPKTELIDQPKVKKSASPNSKNIMPNLPPTFAMYTENKPLVNDYQSQSQSQPYFQQNDNGSRIESYQAQQQLYLLQKNQHNQQNQQNQHLSNQQPRLFQLHSQQQPQQPQIQSQYLSQSQSNFNNQPSNIVPSHFQPVFNRGNYGSQSTTDGDDSNVQRASSDTSTSSNGYPNISNNHSGKIFSHHQQHQHHHSQTQSQLPTPVSQSMPIIRNFNPSPQTPQHLIHNNQLDDLAPDDNDEDFDYYTEALLIFFSSDDQPIPQFLYNPPANFFINKPIDNEGHTPLHWASALATLNVIELLISKNANPLILNNVGMNCLSKLVFFTNSYDLKNFQSIIQLLRQCLIVPDARGRTPMHYLMELSAVPNKYNCVRYYFNEIVSFIQFQQREAEKISKNTKNEKDLLKILINHRDNDGDTAFHLALKSKCDDFIKDLIRFGADINMVGISSIPISILKELETENKLNLPSTPIDLSMFSTGSDNERETPHTIIQQRTPATVEENHNIDVSENKENIFNNLKLSDKKEIELSSLPVTSTPSKNFNNAPKTGIDPEVDINIEISHEDNVHNDRDNNDNNKDDDNIMTIQPSKIDVNEIDQFSESLPKVLNSFKDNLNNINDELKHNINTIHKLDHELEYLDKKNINFLKTIVPNSSLGFETDFDTLVNSSSKMESFIQNKLLTFQSQLSTKGNQLLDLYERSQALDVAKLVNIEECEIDENAKHSDKTSKLKLAIELSLLQINRRKLMENLLELESSEGLITNENENEFFDKEESNNFINSKQMSKLFIYKKLISNICDLPIDEINSDLLNGVEMKLGFS